MPVASDLAGLLEAAGLSLERNDGGTVPAGGWNLFTAPLPHGDGTRTAYKAASVVLWGGSAPDDYMGAGRRSLRRAKCQVTIRSASEDFEAGQTLANACVEALHLADHASYLKVTCQSSAANYLPPMNSNGQHHWTFDVHVDWIATL